MDVSLVVQSYSNFYLLEQELGSIVLGNSLFSRCFTYKIASSENRQQLTNQAGEPPFLELLLGL